MPGVVEGDDRGVYVAKFVGAAQGRKALVAEVLAGELARRLGLRVPALLRLRLDPVLARSEPDEQVQSQLRASAGVNLGMAFLSGALGFDPLCFEVGPLLAGRVVWFDALIGNVDRSWRNPNLLLAAGELWLIDHGACLTFHHDWPRAAGWARRPFAAADHALAGFAPDLAAADRALAPLVTRGLLQEAAAQIPDEWLADEPGFDTPDAVRTAYVAQLAARMAGPRDWLPGAAA